MHRTRIVEEALDHSTSNNKIKTPHTRTLLNHHKRKIPWSSPPLASLLGEDNNLLVDFTRALKSSRVSRLALSDLDVDRVVRRCGRLQVVEQLLSKKRERHPRRPVGDNREGVLALDLGFDWRRGREREKGRGSVVAGDGWEI